jgi:DNA-binding NtrC family response regulator
MNNAPVFIIDDDPDELEMAREIWDELNYKNRLEVFSKPTHFLERLREKVNPFLIMCDVNLHGMDGFQLRQKLCEEVALSYKGIPFIFWSKMATNDQIKKAYDIGGHGFFIKGENYAEIKESLNIIVSYWTASKAPILPRSLAEGNEKNS